MATNSLPEQVLMSTVKVEAPNRGDSEDDMEPTNKFQPPRHVPSIYQHARVPICPSSNSPSIVSSVATVKWTRVHAVEKLRSYTPMPRHGHKAVSYENLLIVFGGGNEGMFKEVMVFDSNRREWFKPPIKGDLPQGRAAFGIVVKEEEKKILICGGMAEYGLYIMDLYELNIPKWEWKELHPMHCRSGDHPCPRMGHSFTILGTRVFLFGGLANVTGSPHRNIPQYLNDLYILSKTQDKGQDLWECPPMFGVPPSPRESHSAVAYFSNDSRFNKLIVFGGMCGKRLGDLFVLDADTLMWSKIGNQPYTPSPRSIHSANIIGERMYVFGGWEDINTDTGEVMEDQKPLQNPWRCTNSLACLNVETMTWEKVEYVSQHQSTGSPVLPCGRAGHCSAVINNRIYIWSGRDGYKRKIFDAKDNGNLQVCCEDMWYLDVQRPTAPVNIKQIRLGTNSIHLSWDPVLGAESYIVQCMVQDVPVKKTSVLYMPVRTLNPQGYPTTGYYMQYSSNGGFKNS